MQCCSLSPSISGQSDSAGYNPSLPNYYVNQTGQSHYRHASLLRVVRYSICRACHTLTHRSHYRNIRLLQLDRDAVCPLITLSILRLGGAPARFPCVERAHPYAGSVRQSQSIVIYAFVPDKSRAGLRSLPASS